QPAAGNRRAGRGNGPDKPVLRQNHGAWLKNRPFQLGDRTHCPDVAQIGTEPRAFAADAMALEAAALPLEDREAAGSVARFRRTLGSAARRTKIADDRRDLKRSEARGRHRRPGDTARNDARQIVVVCRPAKLAAPDIDALNQVPLRPMAG